MEANQKGRATMRYSVAYHFPDVNDAPPAGYIVQARICVGKDASVEFWYNGHHSERNWFKTPDFGDMYQTPKAAHADIVKLLEGPSNTDPDTHTIHSAGIAHLFYMYQKDHGHDLNLTLSAVSVVFLVLPIRVGLQFATETCVVFNQPAWPVTFTGEWTELYIMQAECDNRTGDSLLRSIAFCLKDGDYIGAKSLTDQFTGILLKKAAPVNELWQQYAPIVTWLKHHKLMDKDASHVQNAYS